MNFETATPGNWNDWLAPDIPWREAYALVQSRAREYLTRVLNAGDLISTNTLVEALYPARFAKGEGITARRRMYKALAALATHGLADCCTKGAEKKFGRSHKPVKPWLWHAPRPAVPSPNGQHVTCPHCGERFEMVGHYV